jgi:hypothetical protein
MDVAQLFGRHLDLTPLRGRRRGVVRCIFQPRDRTPSLSIDMDRGVFFCHSCGVCGGYTRFAELVGEAPARLTVPLRRGESPLAAARRATLRAARGERWASEGVQLLWRLSDWMRANRRKVDTLRQFAGRLGSQPEQIEACHLVLARAAQLETLGAAIEAEVDDILSTGRIE